MDHLETFELAINSLIKGLDDHLLSKFPRLTIVRHIDLVHRIAPHVLTARLALGTSALVFKWESTMTAMRHAEDIVVSLKKKSLSSQRIEATLGSRLIQLTMLQHRRFGLGRNL